MFFWPVLWVLVCLVLAVLFWWGTFSTYTEGGFMRFLNFVFALIFSVGFVAAVNWLLTRLTAG